MKILSTFVTLSLFAFPSMALVLSEYSKLLNLCQAGGENTYVAVRYSDGIYRPFNFGQCYPFEIDGGIAQLALFCKPATCYINPNPDCTGGAVPPVPIPIPVAPLMLPNALDFIEIVGKAATCHKNGLS